MKKVIALSLLIAFVLCGLSACGAKTVMTVDFLKLGKADCCLISDGEHTIVIDCGKSDDADKIIRQLRRMEKTRIDLLIISHYDKDHFGGASALTEAFEIAQIIEPDYSPEPSELYDEYLASKAAHAIPVKRVKYGETLCFGDIRLEINGAGDAEFSSSVDNNNSLTVLLEHAGNRIFFAGDIEKARTELLLSEGADKCDVIKLPHHGVYNSALPKLLETTGAAYAVITCSKSSPAEAKTLKSLNKLDITPYLTCDGAIRLISSAKGIEIRQ